MSEIKVQWAWSDDNNETAHGPFDSRDAAIAAAQKWVNETATYTPVGITLGVVEYAKPEEHLYVDMDDLLADMGTDAAESFPDAQDKIFYVEPSQRPEAKLSLAALLRAWVARWVKSDTWIMVDDGDDVLLTPQCEEKAHD